MAEPLKNQFDRALVELLANRFAELSPGFDTTGFTARLLAAFPGLELKERINLIADELASELPDDYRTALAAVVAAADTDGIDEFSAWPLCSFVERHGVGHPTDSLEAMESLTVHFSCEFAIRPFLENHLEETLAHCRRWIRSDNEAVRRLPSEGTRPYLPWGPKVPALLDDPEIGIGLIAELRHDPSETVRRSVANHLNDLARNHPARVVEIAGSWAAEAETDDRMIRHALRSLIKKGDIGALGVLGFTTDADIEVDRFRVAPSELLLGDNIQLEATISSTGPTDQRLVIDFVVHHMTAAGTTIPKVFKWKTVTLGAGASITIGKRRRIATASTRRYHAGVHAVELQVAGRIVAGSQFTLLESSN